ncbi:MAG: hypothetical protein H6492_02830 [Candidatus Paracaedibacteraceae bacterium]|nr:hypothetical protein [Candidatus Paracaedibacteraceae bacterium]
MRILFFIFLGMISLKNPFAAEELISAVPSVMGADNDSIVLKEIDLKFLTPIFSKEHIDCFVLMYKDAAPLYRMFAHGRAASESDYLRAIYTSMKMRWPSNSAMEIVPKECDTLEDNINVLKFIYVFIYKINCLNQDLAGKVMEHIQRKSELPSCKTLERFWEELQAERSQL